MSRAVKLLAEKALIASGIERVAKRRLRGRTLVLAYHNILPQGERISGDASLHLPEREFGRQLDALAQSHAVVTLETLLREQPEPQPPRVIITFDDAYQGALTAGVDELVKRGMPATIFVAPALLGSLTWWDRLAEPKQGGVPLDVRQHALETLGGRSNAVISWASSKSIVVQSESRLPRIGTEAELRIAATKPGITLGSHSWSHLNLSSLTKTELEAELSHPLEWLRSRFAAVAPYLSYPYGEFNQAVESTAAKVGYLGALRIDGGWIPRSLRSPYAIPRLNIPSGLSISGFRLRLAGL